MKKIFVICVIFLLALSTLSLAEDEKKEEKDSQSICPRTKMSKDCLSCHITPDFRLKESRPDAHYDYPQGVKIVDSKGYYLLEGEIGGAEANKVRDYFNYLRLHKIDHAVLDIHSGGGSLFSGWRIKGLIDEFQADGGIVETQVRGIAASAAAIIFVSGNKGHRVANPQSELMFHELWSVKFLDISTPSDKEDEARVLRHLQDTITSWLATRGKLTKNELDEKVRKREFWINGKEALELGFVDRVIIGN